MTTAPLDSLDARIRRAIAEKRLLEIRYKRAVRLVEPHDYGVIDGTERLLIFQLRGPLLSLKEVVLDLILPAARPQRRFRGAHKRDSPEGPL